MVITTRSRVQLLETNVTRPFATKVKVHTIIEERLEKFEQNKEATTERASEDLKVKETTHTKEFMPLLSFP